MILLHNLAETTRRLTDAERTGTRNTVIEDSLRQRCLQLETERDEIQQRCDELELMNTTATMVEKSLRDRCSELEGGRRDWTYAEWVGQRVDDDDDDDYGDETEYALAIEISLRDR